MAHRVVLSVLISLFLFNSSAGFADVWAISRDGANGSVHVYKNGKIGVNELPIPGIARDLAITKDGAYLYISYSDINCGRVPPEPPCWGEGLVVFDTKTKQNVLQVSDIPDPGTLVIDETDAFLYLLCGGCKNFPGSIQKYDISKLATGGRNFALLNQTGLWEPAEPSRLAVGAGDIAFADKAYPTDPSTEGEFFWYGSYCREDTLWAYPGGAPACVVIGLPRNTDPNWGNYRVNDVMISPDKKNVFMAFSVVGVTFQFGDPRWGNVWAVRGPAEEGYSSNITSVMQFGSAGVSRMVSVGTRFYAITTEDGFLYCGDFNGVSYPPLSIGGHLSGLAYNDGTLYVSEADNRVIYPVTLGKTPRHDRIGKGYAIPFEYNFSPGAVVAAPTPK